MSEKKNFGQSAEAFFAGKGFYIVLFLCVAVIGAAAWAMLTDKQTDVENGDGTLSNDEVSYGQATVEYPLVTQPVIEYNAADYVDASLSQPEPPLAPIEAEEDAAVQTAVAHSDPIADVPVAEPVAEPFFVCPVVGQVENAYSMTVLAYDRTMKDWRTHDGIDLAAQLGTQVRAASAGTVMQVYDDDLYGTTVVISHAGGLQSIYSNLASIPTVSVGDSVEAGQIIGSVGDTALCETGEVTHLHFAMSLDGASVDPSDYLP